MPSYSVAEAKNNLPKLLDKAVAGEEVTITRRGKPIATLVAKVAPSGDRDIPKSPRDMEWIRRHRVTPKIQVDAVELIRKLRDEGY